MKKWLLSVLSVMLVAACASTAAKVKIADPEIQLQQVSSMPAVAEHVTGGMPVNFAMAVTNRWEPAATTFRRSHAPSTR
jgi:hypothetical protein